jgi:hypothetical protein
MEKMIRRSGVAKPPKLHRRASPQHWTHTGNRGGDQVRGHGELRALVESKGRRCHAPMAQRKQLR